MPLLAWVYNHHENNKNTGGNPYSNALNKFLQLNHLEHLARKEEEKEEKEQKDAAILNKSSSPSSP